MADEAFLNDGRITPNDVLDALINLKQLVFEVTDACNLRCRYCAYGDLYYGYDNRSTKNLTFELCKTTIDYLAAIWKKGTPSSQCPHTYVSFYGGEPLLNMPLIEQITNYMQSLEVDRQFSFTITTNGMLLDRYMDYLVGNRFHILISLDGDEVGNGFRLTPSGKNSFGQVFSNTRLLQTRYPDFFSSYVNFNSVLHSLNSAENTIRFVRENFGKTPYISELNTTNIKEEKREEFTNIFRSKRQSIAEATDNRSLSRSLFLTNPDISDVTLFIHQYSNNVYKDYNDLITNPAKEHHCPTGTCIPFSKKLFLTVNGKVLPCEKISQKYSIGTVEPNLVKIDFQRIAENHNAYLDKMQKQCSLCKRKKSCQQCMYYVNDIDANEPRCQSFMGNNQFREYAHHCLAYLRDNADLYKTIIEDVYVD